MLADLRAAGLAKMDSHRVLRDCGIPLADAKTIIHNSSVWADRREADEHQERKADATLQIQQIISGYPDLVPARFRQPTELGAIFAALAFAGRDRSAPTSYWEALSTLAATLCLDEALGTDFVPAEADADYLHAALLVRTMVPSG